MSSQSTRPSETHHWGLVNPPSQESDWDPMRLVRDLETFNAEGILKEALVQLWEQARAKDVEVHRFFVDSAF